MAFGSQAFRKLRCCMHETLADDRNMAYPRENLCRLEVQSKFLALASLMVVSFEDRIPVTSLLLTTCCSGVWKNHSLIVSKPENPVRCPRLKQSTAGRICHLRSHIFALISAMPQNKEASTSSNCCLHKFPISVPVCRRSRISFMRQIKMANGSRPRKHLSTPRGGGEHGKEGIGILERAISDFQYVEHPHCCVDRHLICSKP
jgi:hypothetical protein